MFPLPAPLAGSKRQVNNVVGEPTTAISAAEAGPWSDHGGPGALSTRDRKPGCPSCEDGRPSKRQASAHKVGEYHNMAADQAISNSSQQFPDICFEAFCQGHDDWDAPSCNSPCAVPCPGEEHCSDEDACWDPHCDQICPNQCADSCVDPECEKTAAGVDPCFRQTCDAQPCPLGDPDDQCHLTHFAPTPANTVYCYDDSTCPFQKRQQECASRFPGHEMFPCYSHDHERWDHHHAPGPASGAVTPVLSPGNYTSIESTFSTPAPSQLNGTRCYLDIPAEHCHIDNSCCHGPSRACGDYPNAPQELIDHLHASTAQGNGLANNFSHFALQTSQPSGTFSLAPSTPGTSIFDNSPHDSMSGFNGGSWLLPHSLYSDAFQSAGSKAIKFDFDVSAARDDAFKPEVRLSDVLLSPDSIPRLDSGSAVDATAGSSQSCICKWQHAPGVLCLANFPSPETLHKHIKTAHVENCAHCVCQWEGCEASTKDFKQRSKLSRHLLAHAGHRPYACSFEGCNRTFATNQAKDNHERTHTGERPYVCDRCGYTTTTHTQLQTHISALHEGKKPHKCRFCDFSCADSSNLSKHERTHQTLRPYRCPHSGCTFKPDCRWENLKRHLRRSGHCPQLLIEGSEEAKSYRENVKRETEEWNKRAGESAIVKMGRRKRGSSS